MSDKTLDETIHKICISAKKQGFKKITFKFAGGEPLLALNKIIKAVDLATKLTDRQKIKAHFVVLTNGVLLTEKTCLVLKSHNIRVGISLDGLDKYHDKTRVFANGSGSFSYVERGIRNVQKFKIPCTVTITITAKNIENIPAVTAYLLKRNIPFIFNFYRENPLVKEELNNDHQRLIYYLKKAYKLIETNPKSDFSNLLDRVDLMPHLYPCGVGRNYLVVRYDGKLIGCPMTQNKPIGSIEMGDVMETMQKSRIIRPKNITVEDKKLCQNCQWRYACAGGCPLLTHEQYGRYDMPSPYCDVYKALIPELLRMEARRLISMRRDLH